MNLLKLIPATLLLFFVASCNDNSSYKIKSEVPDLIMPQNGLKFKEIEDYKNYKIIATHFRTDKDELRYILANEIAYNAYKNKKSFPNGSKIVKIGWDTEKMSNFSSAIEAKEIQRIEYMIKDSENFSNNPGNWGYARFVKDKGKYKSWDKGTKSCVSCHNIAKNSDFLFTKIQKLE